MAGFYKETIKQWRKKAHSDIQSLELSLDSLKNDKSIYAQEHRLLLEVLNSVAEILDEAPIELTTNQ